MTPIRSAVRLFPLLLATAIGAFAVAQEPAPKHLLRNACEVGKTTWYRQTMVMEQKVKVLEKAVDGTVDTELVFRVDTRAVADGKATERRTFTRIKAKTTGMMKVEFDTDDPEARPGLLAPLADMVGEWLEVQVDDRGRVADVKQSPDFPEGAVAALGGDKHFVTQTRPPLPDAPVAIGESWIDEATLTMAGLGELKTKTTTTLVKIEGKQATVHQRIEMGTDGVKLPAGVTMTVDKAEGDTTLDLANGMPIASSMSTTMHLGGGGAAAMDMTIVMKVDLTRIEPPTKSEAGRSKAEGNKDSGK